MERRFEREWRLRDLGYKAPPEMIRAATAARLAGDWRAACAAADVDVHVDLADVRRLFGPAEADRIEADLLAFAPDYLRLHLYYLEGVRLMPHARVVLSTRREPMRPGVPVLVLTMPPGLEVAQRLSLRVADIGGLDRGWHDLPGWAWHAGFVADRRWAYGASETRLPWHDAEGRPYEQGVKPQAGTDRAAEFEAMTVPMLAPRVPALYAAAGFRIVEHRSWDYGIYVLRRRQWALPVLAAEAHRLVQRYNELDPGSADRLFFRAPGYGGLTLDATDPGALTIISEHTNRDAWRGPAIFTVDAPPDVALLRARALTPDQLHPLAHEALFPDRVQQWQPSAHDPYAKVRVRCRGEWHTVEVAGASLLTPQHDDAEIHREFLLAGLGGKPAGCAAALAGFRSGRKPVPKDVRKARKALFARAFHGDTEALLADLRAGADPRLRAPGGGTLMHLLAHVDHERVLPVLLAAGFSLTDRDADGETPLHSAALSGREDVMRALVAAGADEEARDSRGRNAAMARAAVKGPRQAV